MDDMIVLCNQCGISFARFLHTAVKSLSACVPVSVRGKKKKKKKNRSMPGGFNRNDITPSSPGFDVCMASVVPALVRHAAVFELPVSSVHFTFCLIRMLEKRRPGKTRVQGAVFKHKIFTLLFKQT